MRLLLVLLLLLASAAAARAPCTCAPFPAEPSWILHRVLPHDEDPAQ